MDCLRDLYLIKHNAAAFFQLFIYCAFILPFDAAKYEALTASLNETRCSDVKVIERAKG